MKCPKCKAAMVRTVVTATIDSDGGGTQFSTQDAAHCIMCGFYAWPEVKTVMAIPKEEKLKAMPGHNSEAARETRFAVEKLVEKYIEKIRLLKTARVTWEVIATALEQQTGVAIPQSTLRSSYTRVSARRWAAQ